jgi:hypothetical protein
MEVNGKVLVRVRWKGGYKRAWLGDGDFKEWNDSAPCDEGYRFNDLRIERHGDEITMLRNWGGRDCDGVHHHDDEHVCHINELDSHSPFWGVSHAKMLGKVFKSGKITGPNWKRPKPQYVVDYERDMEEEAQLLHELGVQA